MEGNDRSRSGVLQWVVVLVVGVFVVTVVAGLNLIPRLSDGQKVLERRPAGVRLESSHRDAGGHHDHLQERRHRGSDS